MKAKILIPLIFCLTLPPWLAIAQKRLDNTIYCQNTLWGFENKPETALQKAELMKAIGFDGLEGFGFKDFFELKDALDSQGISMPVNYVVIDFEADGKLKDIPENEIKTMIKSSAKGVVIYFSLINKAYMHDKDSGDKVVASAMRKLADFAVLYDIKLCSYPHLGMYCETVAHSVKLAKLVNRKNFGASLNLCHLLKIEGSAGLNSKIKEFTPFLFAVNICGADDGDTKQYGWKRLIQPLGQGSFDTYLFVKSLRDNGYIGPVGLQCYNLKGDVVETLTQSMKTWQEYKKRYTKESKNKP